MSEGSNGEVPEKWRSLPVEQQEEKMKQREAALANPAWTKSIGRLADKEMGDAGRAQISTHKRKRTQQRLAEAASEDENYALIEQVFKDAVAEDAPLYIRLQGAKDWVGFEKAEDERTIRRRDRQEDLSREEIISRLADRFLRLQERGAFITYDVEGTARELPRQSESE